MQLHSNQELDRFFKFSIVGGIGAIIDLGVLNILVFMVGWETELERIFANIISVSAAILFNFTLHRHWTFPEYKDQNQRVLLIKFAIVSFIGLVINTIIFHFSYAYLFSLWTSPAIAVQLAKSTAIGLTLFWNFGANRLWTYRALTVNSAA